jgi:tRNA (guanine-N7-)-methyltransferase
MPQQDKQHRPIRSYVLRQGRMTPGQQHAFDSMWPLFGIKFSGQQLDLPSMFGNSNPIYIEIGCGNGEALLQMAAVNRDNNYLGIEVHRPGVGHLLLRIKELGLTNIRVICHDAIEVITQGIAADSLAGVYLFFPDPWHKKRHHKRRIVQAAFITELSRIIRPGGIFHAATDWEDYALQMMELLTEATEDFSNCAGQGSFSPRPEERPLTKFEQRGERLGHGIWDLIFCRI